MIDGVEVHIMCLRNCALKTNFAGSSQLKTNIECVGIAAPRPYWFTQKCLQESCSLAGI